MSKTEKEKIVEDINEEALIENKGIAFKRKRSGVNFLLTLAILAVFAASGFSLIYVVESSVFEVGNLNIVDFAIISYNAFVEFIGTAPSIESFISYQNVAFIFVIAAIIFFALSGVYCILASFFNLIRRRTDRLFDLFARSFTSSLTVTLLISLLSRNISGVSVYGTVKFIPGIGLMAVSALGVAVVMLFYFKERRVAISRQIAEKERIARRNALMGFIGYALIFAVAAYSSLYETIYYCYELLFSLIESLIGGYFSLSALLLTAFCVIPTLTLLISGFKALYGIFYDVPFALNVNQAIPEATSVKEKLQKKLEKRRKKARSFVLVMISGAISVGIVIYVIYSGWSDLSLLIEPLILFALLTVLSIVFQILSHKRIPKRTAS